MPLPTVPQDDEGRASGLSTPGAGSADAELSSPVGGDELPPSSVSRPSGIAAASHGAPSVIHPRGRILPPLPASEPRARRLARIVVRLAQGLYHHDDIFHAAPAMAFHFFLSLLPLLVFLGYVLGLVAQAQGASAVFGLVLHNLPSTTEAVLESEMQRLASADRLGPLAAVGFLWIASGGTQGLMQAIERVVGVPRRPWWKQRLLALAWVVGVLIAVPVASFGIVKWEEVVDRASVEQPLATSPTSAPVGQAVEEGESNGPQVSVGRGAEAGPAKTLLRRGGERLLAIALSFVVAVGGLAAFYRTAVAHKQQVKRRVLPGALVAVGLIIVVSWGFGLYVRTLASYTVYYGSLAAIAVLIVWLWLISLVILVGAELNSQLEGLRDLDREDDAFERSSSSDPSTGAAGASPRSELDRLR